MVPTISLSISRCVVSLPPAIVNRPELLSSMWCSREMAYVPAASLLMSARSPIVLLHQRRLDAAQRRIASDGHTRDAAADH